MFLLDHETWFENKWQDKQLTNCIVSKKNQQRGMGYWKLKLVVLVVLKIISNILGKHQMNKEKEWTHFCYLHTNRSVCFIIQVGIQVTMFILPLSIKDMECMIIENKHPYRDMERKHASYLLVRTYYTC